MKKVTCVVCPKSCVISASDNGELMGYQCERGAEYAAAEIKKPVRSVSSTVRISGCAYHRVPVKTDRPIEKSLVFEAMKLLNSVDLRSPVKIGDIAVTNVLDTGVNFVVTRNM